MGVARRSGPAHATAQPAGDRLSADEAGQQGEAPAGPLGTVTEESGVRRGGRRSRRSGGPGRRGRSAAGGSRRPGRRASGQDRPAAPRRRRVRRVAPPRTTLAARSSVTWYRSDCTAGPRKACTRSMSAPQSCMDERARPTAPPAVPRQPAWTAARTPASGSTSASGTQSATRMASVTPGDVVTRMSVAGMASSSDTVPRPRCSGPTRVVATPWIWWATTHESSVTPKLSAARVRLRITLSGSSPTCRPRFSES